MKLTIEIDTAKGEHKSKEAIALLGGSVLLSLLDNDMVKVRQTRDETSGQDKPDPGENLSDEDEAPTFRAYGKASDGRARRTKDEMKLDEKIEALWAQVEDEPDMPDAIPTDQPAEDVLAELTEIAEKKAEDGFDVGGDADDEKAEEVLDLEEFRAIIVKHSKTIGGKALGQIMAPYKNPGEVPEDERRDYADKIIEAADAAT
jgi:hypothetical protein